MTTIRTAIHDQRIDAPAPEVLRDVAAVIATIGTADTEGDRPMTPRKIAQDHVGMGRLQSLDIPDDVAAELDTWEIRRNQHGVDHAESGIGGVV